MADRLTFPRPRSGGPTPGEAAAGTVGRGPWPSSAPWQAKYGAWRDQLPESLADSRTAELLKGVCDVGIESLAVELPRGFGRD